jgi:hypothetical protein
MALGSNDEDILCVIRRLDFFQDASRHRHSSPIEGFCVQRIGDMV